MNELVKFLIEMARRIAPTPERLGRTIAGILNHKGHSLKVVALVCIVLYFAPFTIFLLTGEHSREGVEGEFLFILPENPAAVTAFEQRKQGIVVHVSEKLVERLQRIEKTHPTGAALYTVNISGGSSVLTVTVLSRDHRKRFFRESSVPKGLLDAYVGAVREVGQPSIAAAFLPQGSRVEQLRLGPYHEEADSQKRPVHATVIAGVLFALLFLLFYFSLKYNQVFDATRVRTAFGAETRVLRIAKFPAWHDMTLRGIVPEDVFVLSQYLLEAHKRGERTVAIVSADSGQGKSTLMIMLWRVMSRYRRVLLLDADRREGLSRLVSDKDFESKAQPQVRRLFEHRNWEYVRATVKTLSTQVPILNAEMIIADCTPIRFAQEELGIIRSADVLIFVAEEIGYRDGWKQIVERLKFLNIVPDAVVINKATIMSTAGNYAFFPEVPEHDNAGPHSRAAS